MDEQEQRFLSLIEQHRQIIYKVCFMYASDDETISDLYQEIEQSLAELKEFEYNILLAAHEKCAAAFHLYNFCNFADEK